MVNYIRACFCVEHKIETEEYLKILKLLDEYNCQYNVWSLGMVDGFLFEQNEDIGFSEKDVEPKTNWDKLHQFANWLAAPSDIRLSLGWKVQERLYEVRIFRSTQGDITRIVLDVDEALFPVSIDHWAVVPLDQELFRLFADILLGIIGIIRPSCGIVGYEADLICSELERLQLNWGNFIGISALDEWKANDLKMLQSQVDASFMLKNVGLLTFFHPTPTTPEESSRVKLIERLFQRNPLYKPKLKDNDGKRPPAN